MSNSKGNDYLPKFLIKIFAQMIEGMFINPKVL